MLLGRAYVGKNLNSNWSYNNAIMSFKVNNMYEIKVSHNKYKEKVNKVGILRLIHCLRRDTNINLYQTWITQRCIL